MSVDLLDDTMKTQLALEWERFRKALSQAGDIAALNLDEWRIVSERGRKGLPPAVSVLAVQSLVKMEKSGLRGQPVRWGEETQDSTLGKLAQARSAEIEVQDDG